MIEQGSVTIWLNRVQAGDSAALTPLWSRYFGHVMGIARDKLRRLEVRSGDEEDVALSVFHQFFRTASDRRFEKLHNRDDLWHVLVMLTVRKALDHHRHDGRQKRKSTSVEIPEPIVATVADPALEAQFADEMRAKMESLPDEEARAIAKLKLDGYSNDEIAEQLRCTVRTVGRRLVLIRETWKRDTADRSPCR